MADTGTPFLGGTAATIDLSATVESDSRIRATTTPAGVSEEDVRAFVEVVLADGRRASSATPLATVRPPTLTSLGPLLTEASVGAEFRLNGDGLGEPGADVSVSFLSDAGTPFVWGTSDRLVTTPTSVEATGIRGLYPAAAVDGDAVVARVEVQFASGARAVLSLEDAPLLLESPRSFRFALGNRHINSWSGYSVSISGDTAAVGAPLTARDIDSPGPIDIYVRDGTGWSLQQRLPGPGEDGGASGILGFALDLDGDVLVASSPSARAAYVYRRTGTSWSREATLVQSDEDRANNLPFGHTVGVSGDTAIIGGHFGVAYIFERDEGGAWSLATRIFEPAHEALEDLFGLFVDVSGDAAVIGQPGLEGSAYVYRRGEAGWVREARLKAPLGQVGFGSGVAIDADTILVGGGNAVSVFVHRDDMWERQHVVSGEHAFGFAVAVSGDTAIIGAPGVNNRFGSFVGTAFIMVRRGEIWSEPQRLEAPGGQLGNSFGSAVDVSGNTAIVGAPGTAALDRRHSMAGAAYIY
ncbi:MAG: hypothetical protein AAGD14_04670 [Planctomycetota bacterium]